jgi:hypothetical protein
MLEDVFGKGMQTRVWIRRWTNRRIQSSAPMAGRIAPMDSICPEINALHQAFCDARGFEVNMLPAHERWWSDAHKSGLTPDCIKLVVKARMKRIQAGVRHEESLMVRNIAGSDEAIANTVEEAAAIRAKMRVKVMPKGKADVLRATGRSAEPEQSTARPIGEYIEALRKAAE